MLSRLPAIARVASRRFATATAREIRVDPTTGQLPYTATIQWHAAMNFAPKPRDVPPYHYPIILTSVFVFTMYFAFFREENEYDSFLNRVDGT